MFSPASESPRLFPVQHNKTSARTDPTLGPSFGQRDLELFQDVSGRLKGFSNLGASFNLSNISWSPSKARDFFTGSPHFYPDEVEVFYYHGKCTRSPAMIFRDTSPPPTPHPSPRASHWKRMDSYLIDILINCILIAPNLVK